MNAAEKAGFVAEVAGYFEHHGLHALFAELSELLLREKPAEPLEALLARLRHGGRRRVFLVGAPGRSAKEIALELAESLGARVLSVGDLLRKETVKTTPLGQQLQPFVAQGLYAPDEPVIAVVERALATAAEAPLLLIEGFPKTAAQARFLLRKGVAGDRFVQLNFGSSVDPHPASHDVFAFHMEGTRTALRGLFSDVDAVQSRLIPRLMDVLHAQPSDSPSSPLCAFFFAAGDALPFALASALGAVLVVGDRVLAAGGDSAEALRTRLNRPDVRCRGCVVWFKEESLESVAALAEPGWSRRWVLASKQLMAETEHEAQLHRLGRPLGVETDESVEALVDALLRTS